MKKLRLLKWALILVVCSLASAADYVGNTACAPCHPAEYAKQSASHHAHSLHPIDGSLLGAALLKAGHSPDGRLTYEPDGNRILVRENGAADTLLIQWAFGAGVQGSTPVGLFGQQYMEHQFSYYSRLQGFAPTFGHPAHAATPIAELGVFQDSRTIFHCFNCHATGVQMGANGPDLRNMLLGVQCERCHGPGSAHIQAPRKQGEIFNPGRLPAKALIEVCGQCHRLPGPDMGDKPELENPVNVRFAPIGLLASRCFRESGDKLSCLTCHDPHSDARHRDSAFYTERCLSCHVNPAHHSAVQRKNCLPCHMKQASLGRFLVFTDHRIRVN